MDVVRCLSDSDSNPTNSGYFLNCQYTTDYIKHSVKCALRFERKKRAFNPTAYLGLFTHNFFPQILFSLHILESVAPLAIDQTLFAS